MKDIYILYTEVGKMKVMKKKSKHNPEYMYIYIYIYIYLNKIEQKWTNSEKCENISEKTFFNLIFLNIAFEKYCKIFE